MADCNVACWWNAPTAPHGNTVLGLSKSGRYTLRSFGVAPKGGHGAVTTPCQNSLNGMYSVK